MSTTLQQHQEPAIADPSTSVTAITGRFLVVSAQLLLIVLLIRAFHIEEPFGFVSLAPLILAGFVIHALLPMRFRMPFFVGLGMAGALVVFGPKYGVTLVGVGLGLIALCHLPVAYWVRVGLVIGAGAGLAAVRAEWIPAPGLVATVLLPILGAMFMFRMILYLYALRHEKEPISVWQRLGYFFLLPNLCFPLFPVVDWQAFRRTYFDTDEYEIYQKGLLWMLRGITHILLYRLIYHHLLPSPGEVVGLGTVALYMLTTYGLYLRISGQFHLIVGTLCLFGFNLPETHHLYFLATGFNDYWRRINIYWKDFMTKVFYYPTLMRARRWGMTTAMVVSTLVVFAGTWLLHSYQWFWLRGVFPVTATDGLFWGILGALVVVNSLRELKKKGRVRSGGDDGEWSLTAAVKLSARVVGMFVFICVLWSLWSSPSVGAWLRLVSRAGQSGPGAWLLLTLGLAGLVAVGVAIQFVRDRGWTLTLVGSHPPFGRSVAYTGMVGIALLAVGSPRVQEQMGGPTGALIASIQDERLNEEDEATMDRGYYEGLLEAPRYTSGLWRVRTNKPADWVGMRNSEVVRPAAGLLEFELVPGMDGTFKDATFRTNDLGMRDGDYAITKPAGTHRIALLGASMEMGSGVEQEAIFEAHAERRLNEEFGGGSFDRYEILNLSVGGYSVLHNALVAQQKVAPLQPDVVLFAVHESESGRLALHLSKVVQEGQALGIEVLDRMVEATGIERGMLSAEIEVLQAPYLDDVMRWSLATIAESAREMGAIPAVVYVPKTEEGPTGLAPEAARWLHLADEAGFVTMNLGNVFAGRAQRDIVLAPWDTHPNELGHSLLGDALYEALVQQSEHLGMVESGTTASSTPSR